MRVVVAEDLYLLREGMVRLLQAYGHEVVATAGTGPETLDALLTHRPDVSVVDVRMPPGQSDEGLRAALAARRAQPGLPVLILSQHVEQLYARELLADGTGGIGYLLKESVFDGEQFVDALERVAGGGTAMDPAVIAKLLTSGGPPRRGEGLGRPPNASTRCSASWLRDCPTRPSAAASSSAKAPSASTRPRCSANSASPTTTTPTAASSPSSPS